MTAKRTTKGLFVKGQSGNPTGKSLAQRKFRVIDDFGNVMSPEEFFDHNSHLVMVELLSVIVSKKTTAGAKVSAIKLYMEYWRGKAPSKISISHGGGEETYDFNELPQETLAQIVALTSHKPAPAKDA